MYQEFKARAGSRQEAYKSIIAQVRAYLARTQRANRDWDVHTTEWKETELFGGGEMKAKVWIKDAKMKTNIMRFIDSCVGNIARKIEDEFDESKHPRDKGGKFTSKGGEGRGGGKEEKSTKLPWDGDEKETSKLAKKYGISYKLTEGPGKDPHQHIELTGDPAKIKQFIINEGFDGDEKEAKKWVPEAFNKSEASSSKSAKKVNAEASRHIHRTLEDDIRQIAEESADKDEFKYNLEAFLEDFVQDDYANTDERAMDNFGYDKETVHAVAEEMKGEIDDIADDFFEEDDDTSVTGPDDRDYMNEEDDDDGSDQSNVNREEALNDLVDLAFEGFGQNGPDVAKEFFANMGMSKKEIAKFEKENVPDGDWGEWEAKIEELIRENPSKAVENMGEWADEFEGVFDENENSASKDVKSVRSAIDEELFELATTSESEEEFKSKVKRRFDQYRRLLKDDRTNELPVGGKRAEYALKKIQSEIDSGTSEYW